MKKSILERETAAMRLRLSEERLKRIMRRRFKSGDERRSAMSAFWESILSDKNKARRKGRI